MLGKQQQQQSQIRASQTMPQLYYTREDIQEQYLGVLSDQAKGKRQDDKRSSASLLSTSKQQQQQQQQQQTTDSLSSKRARSSDPKRNAAAKCGEESNSSGDEEESSDFSTENSSRGRRARRSHRKRRRRARSASLFSACFQIPNLGSMLPSSSSSNSASGANSNNNTNQPTQRRSFLSHLGLQKGQQNSSSKQRPISTSQTLGNLASANQQHGEDQSAAAVGALNQQQPSSIRQNNSPAQLTVGGIRKHVSFGGQQQQQLNQQVSSTAQGGFSKNNQQTTVASMSSPQTSTSADVASMSPNSKNLEQTRVTTSENNVIMRNYQTSSNQQKPFSGLGAAQKEANNSSSQYQSTSSPIYLVSSHINSPAATGTAAAAAIPQPQMPTQVIYHNYPAILEQQKQQRSQTHFINNQQQMHSGQQQQQQTPPAPMIISQQILPPSIPQGYLNQQQQQPYLSQSMRPQTTRQQQQQQQTTIYKRLPAVPMRTQATQTEITAYHLMGTPPLSSASSTVGRPMCAASGSSSQRARHTPTSHQLPDQQLATDSPGSSGTVPLQSANQTPVRVADQTIARTALYRSSSSHSQPQTTTVYSVSNQQQEDKEEKLPTTTTKTKTCDNNNQTTGAKCIGSNRKSRSERVPQTVSAPTNKQVVQQRNDEDGSDEWSVDEEEEEDDEQEDVCVIKSKIEREASARRTQVGAIGGVSSTTTSEKRNKEKKSKRRDVRPEVAFDPEVEIETEMVEIVGECGNLRASTLLSGSSSSSCSSSSSSPHSRSGSSASVASLVGHDSTLALQLVGGAGDKPHKCSSSSSTATPTCKTRKSEVNSSGSRQEGEKEKPEVAVCRGLAAAGRENDDNNNNETIPPLAMAKEEENEVVAGASIMQTTNYHHYGDSDDHQHPPVAGGLVKLKNDNMLSELSVEDSHLKEAHRSSPSSSSSSNNNSGAKDKFNYPERGEADIEPPCQFKDTENIGCILRASECDEQQLPLQLGFDYSQQQQERASSPPSLSEASSQTEPSMVAHIMDLGESLSKSRQFVVANRNSKWSSSQHSNQSSDLTEDHEFSSRIDQLAQTSSKLANKSRQQVVVDDEFQEEDESLLLNDDIKPFQEQEQEQQQQQIDKFNYGDEDDDYVSGDYHNDNNEASNRNAPSTSALNAINEDEKDLPLDQSKKQQQQQDNNNKRILLHSNSSRKRASPAEQRRDHFLTLNSEAHEDHQLEEKAKPEVEATQLGEVAISASVQPQQQQQRPSTSTLSTRHHSYCSSDDFNCSTNMPMDLGQLMESSAQLVMQLEEKDQLLSLEEDDEGKKGSQMMKRGSTCSSSSSSNSTTQRISKARDLMFEEIDETNSNQRKGSGSISVCPREQQQETFAADTEERVEQLSLGSELAPILTSEAAEGEGNNNKTEVEFGKRDSSAVVVRGEEVSGPLDGDGDSFVGSTVSEEEAAAKEEEEEEKMAHFPIKEATNGADKANYYHCSSEQTIKRDSDSGGRHFMVASTSPPLETGLEVKEDGGGHKILLAECKLTHKNDPSSSGAILQPNQQQQQQSNQLSFTTTGQEFSEHIVLKETVASGEVDVQNNNTPTFGPSTTSSDRNVLPCVGVGSSKTGEQQQQTRQLSEQRKSSASPPTTVSELDDISTPSFVDSYRNRLQEACKVADSVLGQLMVECLVQDQDQEKQTGFQSDQLASTSNSKQQIERQRTGEDLEGNSLTGLESSSLTSTEGNGGGSSSTSVSGHSYACCHVPAKAHKTSPSSSSRDLAQEENSLNSTQPISGSANGRASLQQEEREKKQRPKLPEKPAHLRNVELSATSSSVKKLDDDDDDDLRGEEFKKDAAAALVVATTSVAGAAAAVALQQNQLKEVRRDQQLVGGEGEEVGKRRQKEESSGDFEGSTGSALEEKEETTNLGFVADASAVDQKQAEEQSLKTNNENLEKEEEQSGNGSARADACPLEEEGNRGAQSVEERIDSNQELVQQQQQRSGSVESPASDDIKGNSSSSFDCPALVSRSGSVCSAVSVIQSGSHKQKQQQQQQQLNSQENVSPSEHKQDLAEEQKREEQEGEEELERVESLRDDEEAALTDQSSPQSAAGGQRSSVSCNSRSSGSSSNSSSSESESRQATQGSGPPLSCASSACIEQERHHHPQMELLAATDDFGLHQEPEAEGVREVNDEFVGIGGELLLQTRRSSQELSTVSEVSEGELSLVGGPPSLAANIQTAQTPPSPSSSSHRQRQQAATTETTTSGGQIYKQVERSVGHQEAPSAVEQLLVEKNCPIQAAATAAAARASELSQLADLATEHDLAHSEYTLRSEQGSEAAVLTAGSSEATDYVATNKPTAAGDSLGTAADVKQNLLEQRRRSSSIKVPSSTIKAAGVDCPYVPDILPLSPPPPMQPSSAQVQSDNLTSVAQHHGRLSHDDTMEAIEDDVEGEEQELQLLQQQQQVAHLDIEPPPAFGCGEDQERLCVSTADSIKEEDEEDLEEPISEAAAADDEEEDEESSISVSQHGVIVSQEVPSPGKLRGDSSRRSTLRNSPTQNSESSSRSSTRHTPLQQQSPVILAPQKEKFVPLEQEGNLSANIEEVQESKTTSKSLSTESATHAILEHLSRHHPELLLDEPAPALEQHDNTFDLDEQASSSTGTMKRKLKDQTGASRNKEQDQSSAKQSLAGSKPLADQQVEQEAEVRGQKQQVVTHKRGPPLSQMKTITNTEQHRSSSQLPGATAVSGSMATDTSICSSCSCLETSFDSAAMAPTTAVANEELKQATEIQQQQLTTATGSSSSNSGGQQQAANVRSGANWMSQEEGTVFTENYWLSHWLYISEHEESEIWRQAIDMSNSSTSPPTSINPTARKSGEEGEEEQIEEQAGEQVAPGMPRNMSEMSSTQSERGFSSKYKSTTRKMIHRRATIEMYKRIMNDNLKREKRVEISRSNGEFGFRIHGSRPVVVSAIERGTSAETCGLQVGDLIYAINGTNILDMAHSDVVKLAHSADSSALVLDLVPTNDFLRMSKYNRSSNKRYEPTVTGYLMRLSPSTAQPLLVELQDQMSRTPGASSQQRASKLNEVMRLAWRKRYFVLRSDNCLYWYRSPTDIEPYGGINLQGFSASLTNEFNEPNYVIRLVKYGGQPHYLGTNNICDIQTWIDAINKAATEANQNDPYMKRTLTLARTKPSQIPEPDCSGYLYKFSHKRSGGAHWRAAYFVLKDACLYLFRDQQADTVSQASAVYYLHGYKVRNKHIEHKKHTFELIPPNRKTIRPMFLMASSEIDRKRWIAALEYSIDRWIEID